MKVLTSSELKEKINNGETFIVDMYADWCGPCRVLGPIVERVSKKLQEENVGIGVYKFDIESDKEYAVSLGIRLSTQGSKTWRFSTGDTRSGWREDGRQIRWQPPRAR